MRPRPHLRWLYRSAALPAVECGEFSYFGNQGPRRYCLTHAGCPVIAVPAPALDRAAARAVRASTTRAFRT
jgi:hypothetical protein